MKCLKSAICPASVISILQKFQRLRKLKILACLTRKYNETTDNTSPIRFENRLLYRNFFHDTTFKKTRLRDFREKLILSSRMKREWRGGGGVDGK